MPTEADLARMRRTVAAKLPDTVEILTAVRTSQPAGGWKDDWDAATVETVAGLVLSGTEPGERTEGGKQVSEVRWIVRLPHGTVVTAKQRLRVNGTTYQILTFSAGQSFGVAVECLCRTL